MLFFFWNWDYSRNVTSGIALHISFIFFFFFFCLFDFSWVIRVCALNCAVLMLHEQAAPAVTSMLSSSTARRCHTSVLLQEQRDETGPPAHIFKKDATSWVSLLFYIIMTYRLVYLKCLCILNLGLSIDFFKFFLLLSF
jgi:hypothetical protein